ncbi:prepilin peptidase [Spongiibacter sp. KMU-158]|uniref:Prepilin peptidase n=1 Tax=Spongiibacter pelagi TaxID=2760804 RepID=A0A927BZK4_9GAMM|nr:A24 family peptidase [Spongiibacter pelagi]MBD2858480.1 prepilin peptidase [Spongiibacter pelagi]
MTAGSFYLLLAIIGIIDWRKRRIANLILLPLFAAGLLKTYSENSLSFSMTAICIACGLALTLPGYIKGIVGGGDIKLMVALSPAWQIQELLFVFVSGVLVLAPILFLVKPTDSKDRDLPLGTAIALGAFVLLVLQFALPESHWMAELGLYG